MARKDIARWDPFSELLSLKDDFDRIFRDFMGFYPAETLREGWLPPVDIKETPDNIVVSVEVPGMKKEDIKVVLNGNQLTISGERKMEKEEKDETYHRIERAYGKFQRTITLPVELDESKVKASYEQGVLRITLPKAEKAKPKEIKVEVK